VEAETQKHGVEAGDFLEGIEVAFPEGEAPRTIIRYEAGWKTESFPALFSFFSGGHFLGKRKGFGLDKEGSRDHEAPEALVF